jgi:hypothetical protein
MSKGSPIVHVRVDPALLHCLDSEIAKVNKRRSEAPYTRSSFILAALRDKLKHLFRSRKEGKRTKKDLTPPTAER